MRPKPWRLGLWCCGVLAIPACSGELAQTVDPSGVTADVRESAISLDQALREDLLEASPESKNSCDGEMAILLKPLHDVEPWIRIGPGWVASGPSNRKESYVTCGTKYVRLVDSRYYRVYLPHLKLHKSESFVFPHDSQLSKIPSGRVPAFLKMITNLTPRPTRKQVQIALWVLSEDIPYSELRPASDPKKPRRALDFVTPMELLQIMTLLERAGHKRNGFRLWIEAIDELGLLVENYEDLRDFDDREAIVPFKKICAFYPLPVATDILSESFDLHGGVDGLEFRSAAIVRLSEVADARALTFLEDALATEEDDSLIEEIERIVRSVAANPGK